ncbi:MAG TPA: hypothetical protein DHW14_04975, partial [Clostridiales bacterium]|nr:hypothetical protein [Clostridiales bacterium]
MALESCVVCLDDGDRLDLVASVCREGPPRSFSLPLWDSRRLDEGFLELGRTHAQGGAVALSVALLAETRALRRLYGESKDESGPLGINPYLFRCLDSAVGQAAPGRPVSIALLR